MIKWIKCSDALPTKEGNIAILINNVILIAEVKRDNLMHINENKIYYFLHFIYGKKSIEITGGYWYKPMLYADITHWTELPEVPYD